MRKSFFSLAMLLPPGEETYYFQEASGREITTQKEEDRQREKGQRGTTAQTVASVGHMFCVDLSSLRVSPFLRVVTFTPPPPACSLVFLPHLMRHFSDVCH